MVKPIIEFKNIYKDYDGVEVLRDINLTIDPGELFVLVGPSGGGKTTLLKMINGLQEISSGQIFIHNQNLQDYDLQKLRWQIGYVLQQIALFPTMTVAENIAVIPEMMGEKKEKIEHKIDQLLPQVGLDAQKYRHRYPRELSGGEQQRVGILRALAASPEIILMDEPFSALDPISRTQLQDLVLQLHQDMDTTFVFVTHNMTEALKLGDRIAVMQKGRIIKVDTPQAIQEQPQDEFVENFFAEAQTQTLCDTLLATLRDEQMLHKNNPDQTKSLGHVYLTDTIDTAIHAFRTNDILAVLDHQEAVGYLDRQSVLEYLLSMEKQQ